MNSKFVRGWLLSVLVGGVASQVRAAPESAPLVIAGAESMAPLAEKWLALHRGEAGQSSFQVKGSSASEGLKWLAEGKAAIAMLDRPISDNEIELLRRGRTLSPVCVPVAVNAVVFFVPKEHGLTSLSLAQVAELLSPRTHAKPEIEIAGKPVSLYSPTAEFGAVHVVHQRLFGQKSMTHRRIEVRTLDGLWEVVGKNPASIGFADMAATRAPMVRVLPIGPDEHSPAVLPAAESLAKREYPLTYYWYWVTVGEPQGAARDLIGFVLGSLAQEVVRNSDSGAGPLPLRTP